MIGAGIASMVTVVLAMPLAQASDQDERLLRPANRKGNVLPQHQVRKPNGAPPAQRLSPEERRQLRRDIKDAGREIYPPQP